MTSSPTGDAARVGCCLQLCRWASGTTSATCSPRLHGRVTSTLIGASTVEQLEDNVAAVNRLDFSAEELAEIEQYAVESGVDLWAEARQATG
jgi:hypothetical protein